MKEYKQDDLVDLTKEDLFIDSTLLFPLYFIVAGQFVLYKPEGATFNKDDLDRLEKNSITALYMPKDYRSKYSAYLDKNIAKLVMDTGTTMEEKSKYLIKNAGNVIKGIFDNVESPQNFIKSQALVKNFVDFIRQGIAAFHSILNLSVHDFYTYTHSIGVMGYSIALASQLGVSAKQTLEDIGIAGLLHDIGKSKIPLAIINKPGPLDDKEWVIMKEHARYSYEIASGYEKLPEVSLIAIRQHHENLLGTGYPDGICGPELHFFSKIVTVCDIYSALTTDRPYSKGRTNFDALTIMKSIAEKGQIDKKMFQNLVLMMRA